MTSVQSNLAKGHIAPSKSFPFRGDLDPSNTWFIGPTSVSPP